LLHVVDVSENDVDKILSDLRTIEIELGNFGDDLTKKDKWLVFNKIDLLKTNELSELKNKITREFKNNIYFTSAINKDDLDILCQDIWDYLREAYSEEV